MSERSDRLGPPAHRKWSNWGSPPLSLMVMMVMMLVIVIAHGDSDGHDDGDDNDDIRLTKGDFSHVINQSQVAIQILRVIHRDVLFSFYQPAPGLKPTTFMIWQPPLLPFPTYRSISLDALGQKRVTGLFSHFLQFLMPPASSNPSTSSIILLISSIYPSLICSTTSPSSHRTL